MCVSPVRRIVAALLFLVVAGCGGPSFEDKVRALAVPTGALASLDPQLPPLIKAVEQQRGLPLQLAEVSIEAPGNNAAVALENAYSLSLLGRLSPSVALLLDPTVTPESRDEFLKRYESLIETTAKAADLPRCRFDTDQEFGFFGVMRYLDDASVASRLLLGRAQQAAAKQDRVAALADVLRSLRVCHWLADVRRVEGRVLAAVLRSEALDVAAGLFDAGLAHHLEAEQIYAVLREQLNDWPDDRRMLIGERATVIHAYETIRAGMLDRMITLDERKQLGNRVDALLAAEPAEIDADEARYLRAMQRLIDASQTPYPERSAEIDTAMSEINSAPTLFAATLFSEDLPPAIRTAAQDQATAEAWTIALAAVADLKAPPFRTSPVSGKTLEVNRGVDRVDVTDGDDVLVSLPVLIR